VPGVGPSTALRFVAALDVVTRFASAHKVEAYLGLSPGEKSSSERQLRLGITKAGASSVRFILAVTPRNRSLSWDPGRWPQCLRRFVSNAVWIGKMDCPFRLRLFEGTGGGFPVFFRVSSALRTRGVSGQRWCRTPKSRLRTNSPPQTGQFRSVITPPASIIPDPPAPRFRFAERPSRPRARGATRYRARREGDIRLDVPSTRF
jgi:hypothetical protein